MPKSFRNYYSELFPQKVYDIIYNIILKVMPPIYLLEQVQGAQ